MLRRPSRNTYPLIPFTGYQPLRRGYWHLRTLHRQAAAPLPCSVRRSSFDAGTDMGAITGDIVCPETGDVELYARSTSGDRPGWSGYMKLPAADLRAATGAAGTAIANTSTNKVLLAWGVNRGMAFAADATNHYVHFGAQLGDTFKIRILHHP